MLELVIIYKPLHFFLFCYLPKLYNTWESKCLYLMVIVLTAKKLTWYILILYHEEKKVIFGIIYRMQYFKNTV